MRTSAEIGRDLRRARRNHNAPEVRARRRRRVTSRRVGVLLVAGSLILGLVATLPAGAERPSLTDPPAGAALGAGVEQITPGLPPLHVLEELAAATTTTTWIPAPEIQVSAASLALPPPVGLVITPGGDVPSWAWAEPGKLNAVGIAAMSMSVGCTPGQAVVATAVGLAESNGRTDAVGDVSLMNSTWSYSAGVHQIRGLHREHGTYGWRDPQALLHDMHHNVAAMFEISGGCRNWQPWTMFTNGRWVERLDEAISGVLVAEGVQP